jgi:hypothetical protein
MKIKFKSKRVYYDNLLFPACPVSQALMELIGNRPALKPMELSLVGKMGFDVEIVGEVYPLTQEMNKSNIEFKKTKEGIKVK